MAKQQKIKMNKEGVDREVVRRFSDKEEIIILNRRLNECWITRKVIKDIMTNIINGKADSESKIKVLKDLFPEIKLSLPFAI